MKFQTSRHAVKVASVLSLLTLPFLSQQAIAQVAKIDAPEIWSSFQRSSPRLHPSPDLEPLTAERVRFDPEMAAAWSSFASTNGTWVAYFDRRSGHLDSAEGSGIPWLVADKSHGMDSKEREMDFLVARAKAFVDAHRPLFGLDSSQLALNSGRSGKISDHLWFIDFDVTVSAIPISGARVVFRVNHGNLIQFGTENIPATWALPKPRVNQASAFEAVSTYLGSLSRRSFVVLDRGSLRVLPTAPSPGKRGIGLASVWEITLRPQGTAGTWRARVDAQSGEVLEFEDLTVSAQATGGVVTTTPDAGDVVRAMPFTNLSTGGSTNSAGIFDNGGRSATTSLSGPFVRIADGCGAISASTNAAGDLPLGASFGTNCTTPGSGGSGNTRSARTQFYWLNRIKEVGRGWLPNNAWLSGRLSANVNLASLCNAYWNGTSVNFFQSSGICSNTGEIPGVSIHEYGHGLDSNDGNGPPPENGTGETSGDWTAALALHDSCIGRDFRIFDCAGYGNFCLACTGVRELDWARRERNRPSTVANFTQTTCPLPNAQAPNYVGPCGADAIARGNLNNRREGHCESYVSSEALWDFVNRDLPNPGTGAAWTLMDRLWYLSRSTATRGFTCNTTTPTWTSNGCNIGSLWRVLRAIDDDDGNLANGTPHSAELFAAFDRHGIACAGDPGATVSFASCTPPAAPTLTLSPLTNAATVAWTSSGGTALYDVYRNEVGCDAGFTRIANDTAQTSLVDNGVANGTTYFYQVVAQPIGNEACASIPSTCQAVTPVACVPLPPPTGLSASAASATQIDLSWNPVPGASGYSIHRTPSLGMGTQIGTTTSTSFSHTGLVCGTTGTYTVRAIRNSECESAHSNEVTVSTLPCPLCSTRTLYKNDFETATGLADWTVRTFTMSSPTADWRGVQTCSASSGVNIFRLGGTTCTGDYAAGLFSAVVPKGGVGGVSIPAGSTTTRLAFDHRFAFQPGTDGATLAASLDGSNFSFVPASAILSGGYNGSVSSTCAPQGSAGLPIWTGSQSSFSTVTVDLDAICRQLIGGMSTTGCAGRTLYLGFTGISDCTVSDDGWFLDNVAVSACIN